MPTLPTNPRSLIMLQSVTLIWMLIECAIALWAAARAHSPALLAFGFDSFIELLSAALVLLALVPPSPSTAATSTAPPALYFSFSPPSSVSPPSSL